MNGDNQNKSVDSMSDLGKHFGNDMARLKEQNIDLYADLRTESQENGPAPNEGPDNPVDAAGIQYSPTHQQDIPQLYHEPTEEEYMGAQNDFPHVDPDDEQLFPGGPLQSEINSWKHQYGDQTIFITQVTDQFFICRTLNRHEYKQIVAMPNTDGLMREEVICATCVLWPVPYDWRSMAVGKAGVPSTLSTMIMEQSGFTANYEIEVL